MKCLHSHNYEPFHTWDMPTHRDCSSCWMVWLDKFPYAQLNAQDIMDLFMLFGSEFRNLHRVMKGLSKQAKQENKPKVEVLISDS